MNDFNFVRFANENLVSWKKKQTFDFEAERPIFSKFVKKNKQTRVVLYLLIHLRNNRIMQ